MSVEEESKSHDPLIVDINRKDSKYILSVFLFSIQLIENIFDHKIALN